MEKRDKLIKKEIYLENMQKANKIIDFSENGKKNHSYDDSDYGKIDKDSKPKTAVHKKVIDQLLNNDVKIEIFNSNKILNNEETNLNQYNFKSNDTTEKLFEKKPQPLLPKPVFLSNSFTQSPVDLPTPPAEISKKIYSSKFYYIIFGVITLFTSSALTMLFTVNGGIQNGFHNYALDLTDGTVQSYNVQDFMSTAETYNVEGNIQDFKTNYKRALATSLNWNLLLNNGSSNYYFLNSTDFAIDWSDVDWDHTGYYNITISSNNKFIEGETKQTIAITNHDTVDLNTLDMIALKTTPYVTTDPTAETQNLEDEALQIIKNNSSDPESITADDFNITFSNQNSFSPESGLDLTKDYIVNTMTISANGNNNLINGSQDISIRPQAYDLSSEDMFYESPHSAYTSMGSELSGHMMSDEPHNFNTMYLDIHDVSEQYDTPTDYIWNQQAISLMSMTNQMLSSYSYSWTQNDAGSWTADVSHNDFVGAPPLVPVTPWVPAPAVNPLRAEWPPNNPAILRNPINVGRLPRNTGNPEIPGNTGNPGITVNNANPELREIGRNELDGRRGSALSNASEDEDFMDNFLEFSNWMERGDLGRRPVRARSGETYPDVNWNTYPGDDLPPGWNAMFEETVAETTAETTAEVAADLGAAEETLAAGGELPLDVVEEILTETLESVSREVAAEVLETAATTFGAAVAEAAAEAFAFIAAAFSVIFPLAIVAATIIMIVITFTKDDTMMLPGKISTLANEDLNNKFQEIQNAPVEYGGIPDLPNPTDTNGNFVSWNSIVTSTMTDSTVIEDWNWCPPNGTWEDRFMSWYGYSIVAKPDNGIVTGSANMHIKFYSTSASD